MYATKFHCVALVAVLVLLTAPLSARADLITGTVTGNSAVTYYFPASRASDGSTSDDNLMVTSDVGNDYFVDGGAVPVLTVDLGADYSMNGLALWNYPSAGNRMKDFSLRFATEAEGTGNFGTSITYNPAFVAANSDRDIQQDFSFSQNVTARYLEMLISDNYSGNRVGVAEIQFSTIPEPASMVLLITALLGLLAYAWRKRR